MRRPRTSKARSTAIKRSAIQRHHEEDQEQERSPCQCLLCQRRAPFVLLRSSVAWYLFVALHFYFPFSLSFIHFPFFTSFLFVTLLLLLFSLSFLDLLSKSLFICVLIERFSFMPCRTSIARVVLYVLHRLHPDTVYLTTKLHISPFIRKHWELLGMARKGELYYFETILRHL